MELKTLWEKMMKVNASDLHLKANAAPVFRIDGKLVSEKGESLTPEILKSWAYKLMTPSQQQTFERMKEMDFAISVRGIGRFRVNVFLQRGSIAVAMRAIPISVRRIEELNLPLILKDLALKQRGLVLCTGTTGSGKSTTLAAMIEHVNENVSRHIITIEDPIEYLFRDNLSIICQREVLMDTTSFSMALKHILRQDPDVILIGEIRDRETMDVALKAADTGHLLMSTLHTLNATETINRIISFYPPHQHQHVRVLLATTLVGVVSLRLLPRADGKGRIPAVEILLSTPTIKEYLLDPVKTMLTQSAIEEGYGQYGMQTFDQSIFKLYKDGMIAYDDAIQAVSNPDEFKLRLVGIEATAERGWEAFDKK